MIKRKNYTFSDMVTMRLEKIEEQLKGLTLQVTMRFELFPFTSIDGRVTWYVSQGVMHHMVCIVLRCIGDRT